MNELFYNIIIIVIILVLFLAFILIAYFYSSYNNYKDDVDTNFSKTKEYINKTVVALDNNIKTSIQNNNDKINNTSNYIFDINNRVNRTDLRSTDNYNELRSSISNTNLNISNFNTRLTSNSDNLNRFDNGLKQFFKFNAGNPATTINQALFDYQFQVGTNILSLDLLRKVNAIAGITINTDTTAGVNNNLSVCDISTSNCIDMNVDTNGFNIYPRTTGGLSNLNIYNKSKNKVIAKFDTNTNEIYLGGSGEDAGMLVKDSNVYIKENRLNLLKDGSLYGDVKTVYDKNNRGTPQTFNTYQVSFADTHTTNSITGIYSITAGTTGTPPPITIIINLKASYNIPSNTNITINIPELTPTLLDKQILTGTETSISGLLGTNGLVLSGNNLKFTTFAIIPANQNIRIKTTSGDYVVDTTKYPEPVISNVFNLRQ